MFVVAEDREEFRRLIREEVEASVRKTLVTVQASPTGPADPDDILTYKAAGRIMSRSGETVRGYTVGPNARLRRYKMEGGGVGVKRGEVMALWKAVNTPVEEPAPSADETARAILARKRGKR